MRPDRVKPETPVEIIAMIKVSGLPWLHEQLISRCRELINIFSTSVRSLPAHHSAEKQLAIHMQINKLLELGVIEESQASTYRRWSIAIDLRLCLDQRWPIPNTLTQ